METDARPRECGGVAPVSAPIASVCCKQCKRDTNFYFFDRAAARDCKTLTVDCLCRRRPLSQSLPSRADQNLHTKSTVNYREPLHYILRLCKTAPIHKALRKIPSRIFGFRKVPTTTSIIGGVAPHTWNNSHLVCDPTIQQPGFDLPQQQWSLLNRFRTEISTSTYV